MCEERHNTRSFLIVSFAIKPTQINEQIDLISLEESDYQIYGKDAQMKNSFLANKAMRKLLVFWFSP